MHPLLEIVDSVVAADLNPTQLLPTSAATSNQSFPAERVPLVQVVVVTPVARDVYVPLADIVAP